MKTTIEIPDPLFRKAKASAAERGQTLKQFVTDALKEKLGAASARSASAEPAWMAGFGELHGLRKETARLQSRVDDEFERIEPEDRA